MTQLENLQSLRVLGNSKCKLCSLHTNAKHVCIMGSGPSNARLLFIAEAPGEEEDRKGEVLVGRTGKLLDSILDNLEINREECYLTNVIKCHPPYNTKPSTSKLDICSSAYLRKELDTIRPELIVCLGGMAARVLISDFSNTVVESRNTLRYTEGPLPKGIPFIVTYHPAVTFHQPELLEYIIKDLEWAKRLLAGEIPKSIKKANYIKLASLHDIPNTQDTEWLELDLETDGLDMFTSKKEILSLQLSTDTGNGYYFDWNSDIARELKFLLRDNEYYINGHNLKFDLKWLRMKANIIVTGVINDTIMSLHLLDENFRNKSLDIVSSSHTDMKGHKGQFQKLINNYVKMHKEKKEPITRARSRLWKQAYNAIPEHIRIAYGCADADATGRLRRIFRPKLKEQGLIPLHNLMMDCTKLFVDVECNGMKVDEDAIEILDVLYTNKMNGLVRKLNRLGGDINHNSPLQVKQLIYDKWKCTPHEVKMGRKRVRYSTGKAALDMILLDKIGEDVRDYITKHMAYKKVSKLYGTYIKGMPRFLRDGYIHATWNLTGTETGRPSCNNPNLQQIPRNGEIKRLFVTRYKDGILMQVDVSQGELRIAAHESGERNLIKLFTMSNTDIHTAVAASIYHKLPDDITEEERFNAKTVNFLILYGGGVKVLAQAIKKDIEIAAKLLRSWNKQFPEWKRYVHATEEYIINNHHVRNLAGRYRRIFILDPTTDEGRSALRQGVNAKIQGGLSDYVMDCGVRVANRIKLVSHDIKVIGQVYDSWQYDMPKVYAPQVASIIREEFENDYLKRFDVKLRVPMRVDIKIGTNWKEMEEYD